MKISEMTDIVCNLPHPLRLLLDKVGEKDPEIKRMVVAIDYALSQDFDDRVIRHLINSLVAYLESRYFVDRDLSNTKVVFFLADAKKRKELVN